MHVTRSEVLVLYKKLMLYSRSLSLTDNNYFRNRIASEFRRNKTLCKPEDITFAFKKGEALLQRGSVV
ncbi:unnamed protein product [Parnassius mnemosyne]|uniref:Complex 1 LYR protein domain-containing protein n=1 Tax=Parnassius mnemosyne TaxID=213953 RepID=A0AAV1KEZ4_9NEOP